MSAKRQPAVNRAPYVLVYLDAEQEFYIKVLPDLLVTADYISANHITRFNYIIVQGDIVKGIANLLPDDDFIDIEIEADTEVEPVDQSELLKYIAPSLDDMMLLK